MISGMVALRLLVYSVTAYCVVGAFFYFQQSKLLFPAPKIWPKTTPADSGLAFEDLHTHGVHAWWIPYSATAKTAIVFHGNGYVIEDMVGSELTALRGLELNLLLADYRGYGSSSALTPNETTILEDADTVLDYLTETRRIRPSDVFVIGRSIGSGPAVYLAAKHTSLTRLLIRQSEQVAAPGPRKAGESACLTCAAGAFACLHGPRPALTRKPPAHEY